MGCTQSKSIQGSVITPDIDPLFAYVEREWRLADRDGNGRLSKAEVRSLLKKLNLQLKHSAVDAKFKKADEDNSGELSLAEFKTFLEDLYRRPEVDDLFTKYASGPLMTTTEFLKFLHEEQKETAADAAHARSVIASFIPGFASNSKPRDADYRLGSIAFSEYIASVANSAYDTVHTTTIYQDMKQPLPHYFGAASHNTYLMGHQLKGESSCEAYKNALLHGCRLLELDCWDGEDGEPIIFHGHTLTSKIKFADVIQTVKECSFVTTPYPVVLSLENHCSIPQQQRMAKIMVEILGDMLPLPFAETRPAKLPSPDDLKHKVLIKGKILKKNAAVPEPDFSSFEEGDDDDESEDVEENPDSDEEFVKEAPPLPREENKKVKHATAQELSDITHLGSAPFIGFERSKAELAPWQMSSYSEPKVHGMAKRTRAEFIEHNALFVSKVYPKGTRFDSSNYAGSPGWITGSHYVAFNYQTPDIHMQINMGKFMDNGGCGYLLKPATLLPKDGKLTPPVPKQITMRVISGWQLPKVSGTTKGEVIDPYLKIRVVGVPEDHARFRSKVVQNNGFNPVWDETYTFNLAEPEVAMILIQVYDQDVVSKDDFIGYCALPVSSLRSGYRSVILRNKRHEQLGEASILIHT